MNTKNLLVSLVIGLGLALGLLWGLGHHSRITVSASAPATASTLSTTIVYYDDFEDPTSGWPEIDQLVITSTDTHYRLRYENGQYRIMIDTGDPYIWFHQPDAFAPYSPPSDKYCVEVDLKLEKGQPPYEAWDYYPMWASGGLVFGASEDNTNLYALCTSMGSDGSSMGWRAINNSAYDYPIWGCYPTTSVGGESTGLSPNTWHRLQVGVDGDTIEIWINGVYKGTYEMSGLQDTTRVGLVGGGYEMFPVDYRFDNFRVRPNASCNVSYVCPDGPPFCDYTTVQAAVDAANDGGLIKVAAGTYTDVSIRAGTTQTVYISKTVTIRGGYTTTNGFADPPDPVANPTTLDAQQQGRVFYIAGGISPTLEGLRITGGDATVAGGVADGGGGVCVVSATLTISGSIVTSNTAGLVGGGLYLHASEATLIGNAILSNTAGASGGGMLLWASSAVIEGNVIAGNAALGESASWAGGGGVYLHGGSDAALVNNAIVDNQVANQGGGLYVDGSVAHMLHTTIARNGCTSSVDGRGSGVYLGQGVSPTLVVMTNTILTNHGTGLETETGASAWLDGVLWYDNTTANTAGDGSITVTHAITGTPAFAVDGYHLGPESAAIDQGVITEVTADIDGDVRPMRLLPDLGADEAPIWYHFPLAMQQAP